MNRNIHPKHGCKKSELGYARFKQRKKGGQSSSSKIGTLVYCPFQKTEKVAKGGVQKSEH